MSSWLFTFVSLAGFAMLVAWVTYWMCSERPRSPLRLLCQLMTRQKKSGTKPEKTPETEDPPEGDKAA